jgi:large subunit ribosomal protein L10
LNAAQVKALSDMPPLPVMRATLLGVLQAPAGKLVRTLAEPARGLAAVIKAHLRERTGRGLVLSFRRVHLAIKFQI